MLRSSKSSKQFNSFSLKSQFRVKITKLASFMIINLNKLVKIDFAEKVFETVVNGAMGILFMLKMGTVMRLLGPLRP